MLNRRIAGGVAACAMAVALAYACALPGTETTSGGASLSAAGGYDATEWKYWGGDAGQTRYAPLNQINLQTVNRLKIAWRWTADTSGDPGSANYKSTPLLDDGVLYIPWLNNGMAAIDAGTGPAHDGARPTTCTPDLRPPLEDPCRYLPPEARP